ncbi:MAG: FliM/FliN family flagellar motor switch protein [Bacillota bacterium]
MLNEDEIREFLSKAQANEPVVKKVRFPELAPASGLQNMKIGFDYLQDVSIMVTAELGGTIIKISNLLDLEEGALLELKRAAGDNVDIMVDDQCMARGEVIIIGSNFGVRIDKIYQPDEQKERQF